VDRIYRVSWPLRVHAGAADRTFVFSTCEFGQFPPNSIAGPAGDEQGVDFEAVELITTSRWSKEGLLAIGFEEQQIHTIPLGVDPALFEIPEEDVRSQIRSDLKIPADAFVFLNISAMYWNKGIGPLVAAFAHHRLKNENSVLVLKGGDALYGAQVGEGVAEAQKLNANVSDARVASSLRYVPHNLPQKAIAGLYLASDAYVSPYRAEGFNLPVLEALAAGVPVIVTAGGATDDFCREKYCLKIESVHKTGPHGYHLEPRVESLVEHMQRVADDAPAFRAAAVAGRRQIRADYSWQSVSRRLGDLLAA
jgi:glycosyltransferase involved in cell wall biosynthesis